MIRTNRISSARLSPRMAIGLRTVWLLACMACASVSAATTPQSGATLELQTLPSKLYLAATNQRESLVGAMYFLVVKTDADIAVEPLELNVRYAADGVVLRSEHLSHSALAPVDIRGLPASRLTGAEPSAPTFLPHAFRLQFQVPEALKIDQVQVQFKYQLADGTSHIAEHKFGVSAYEQKTTLVFPFKGRGMVSQGGAFESGHRNRSGMFAVDAIGLDRHYAPMRDEKGAVASYVGWGRDILATGDGTVVIARGDRPDQPVDGVSDPKFYASEYPNGGDPGNHVIIDHGNGEFSMIAHLKQGSVRIKVGDKVKAGTPIGQLGNSGDTTGPHVHVQLQDGPTWEFANALPMRFSNVANAAKGSYFRAN